MEKRNYTLNRSKRKSLSIKITEDAALIVSAPMRMPVSEVERFVASKEQWIQRHIALAQKRWEARRALSSQIDDATCIRLKTEAETALRTRTAFFAAQMGVTPKSVRIGGARSRWGSCSADNRINYSWFVVFGGEELIDYLVVHELAHIRYHDHSEHFWALVESVLPDYRVRRKKLKALAVPLENTIPNQ
ncbi:MAG: M48 family metallopeptidase [Clostridiales Family XIII bacterium]|jgi:predicted metal-dependent hydrolase|nr:M48 family metallopeptidase [Clostridiales Family XIII bacterium]